MGDVGDTFRAFKDHFKTKSKEKKSSNLKTALEKLEEHKIAYMSMNKGIHLLVEGHIDYWPTTGKWIDRKNKNYSRGIFSLLRYLGKLPEAIN